MRGGTGEQGDGRAVATGYLGVAEDVTERRRGESVLRTALAKEREAVERLNELDRAKTHLVSSVSHELRTPITSVLGYAEMLRAGSAGALSGPQSRLLDRVQRNGSRLLGLIEDLLTHSRIEVRHLRPAPRAGGPARGRGARRPRRPRRTGSSATSTSSYASPRRRPCWTATRSSSSGW